MTVQWVPAVMSSEDADKAREVLGGDGDHPITLEGGGGVGNHEYMRLGEAGDVVGKVRRASVRDAAIYFINDAWEEDAPGPGTVYETFVPLSVRNSVVEMVGGGLMCSCSGSCSDPGCDSRAIGWGREYVSAYQKKMNGVDPPVVRVKDPSSSRVFTFTPTVKPLLSPSADEVLDGVVAKMTIKIT